MSPMESTPTIGQNRSSKKKNTLRDAMSAFLTSTASTARIDSSNRELDVDAETSYSLGMKLQCDDPSNKIIMAEEGSMNDIAAGGNSTGNFNHDEGQNCLYKDTHVRFARSNKPDDDSDDGSIYSAGRHCKFNWIPPNSAFIRIIFCSRQFWE